MQKRPNASTAAIQPAIFSPRRVSLSHQSLPSFRSTSFPSQQPSYLLFGDNLCRHEWNDLLLCVGHDGSGIALSDCEVCTAVSEESGLVGLDSRTDWACNGDSREEGEDGN
jgi:hypothetical protein